MYADYVTITRQIYLYTHLNLIVDIFGKHTHLYVYVII